LQPAGKTVSLPARVLLGGFTTVCLPVVLYLFDGLGVSACGGASFRLFISITLYSIGNIQTSFTMDQEMWILRHHFYPV